MTHRTPFSTNTPPLPVSLKLAYVSFLVVQSLEVFLFTFFPQFLARGTALAKGEFFSLRSIGVTLLPVMLFFHYAYHHHPSTPIGALALRIFNIYHGLICVADMLTLWEQAHGHESGFGDTNASLAFHAFWLAGGVVGGMKARRYSPDPALFKSKCF
ncbi:hypothetical protein BOTBODRAFT_38368 [Botryobasidium botryosum FD-172 SS1]|uniref:Uncharacterized protein n=1 Tax=Botryobasidium botryosum (strain FD-172 SS1) TaxID=930990 RepID=A0A067LZW0_BOTB1|nr:hypothetical protein BOTBODRAFT_38368 [Botryobasidium botryosum FD-172 SS1]